MKDRGYTLIELMVAAGIFTLLVSVLIGFFVSSVQSQQKSLASQELIDNVSYNLEYISRALRMARKDLTGSCISKYKNYENTREGRGIKFKNYHDVCQEFFWDISDNRLKESKNGGEAVPLTPAKFQVVSFKTGSSDSWSQEQKTQPRITLFLEIKGKGQKPELRPSINVQTTISQRNLNVQY